MPKLSPESFAAAHLRRITNEIAAFSRPERVALLLATRDAVEGAAANIAASLQANPPTPDPDVPGAEATPAPDEPGAAEPTEPTVSGYPPDEPAAGADIVDCSPPLEG